MSLATLKKKAIQAVNRRGCLLVYPLNNKPLPLSIWSELFPRSKMRWDWDVDGDDRVAELWSIREQMSRSNEVVYVKWFQNRATFFSFEMFTHLAAYLRMDESRLGHESSMVLDVLNQDSPLSTKQLKAAVELEGRSFEPAYNRAMKPLWQHLFLVGYGEFQDSSFPSLGIGSAAVLFEELWRESEEITPEAAFAYLNAHWDAADPFWKFAQKIKKNSPPVEE